MSWIYQDIILPNTLLSLTLYEVASATFLNMEKKVSVYFRIGLCLLRCLSSAAFYGKAIELLLSFRRLVEESKVARTRDAILYSVSKDRKVTETGNEIRTGIK